MRTVHAVATLNKSGLLHKHPAVLSRKWPQRKRSSKHCDEIRRQGYSQFHVLSASRQETECYRNRSHYSAESDDETAVQSQNNWWIDWRTAALPTLWRRRTLYL